MAAHAHTKDHREDALVIDVSGGCLRATVCRFIYPQAPEHGCNFDKGGAWKRARAWLSCRTGPGHLIEDMGCFGDKVWIGVNYLRLQ